MPTDTHQHNGLVPSTRTLDGPLLCPDQAAALLAVKTSWIYDAVRTGRLPCIRVGRHFGILERGQCEPHLITLLILADAPAGPTLHPARRRCRATGAQAPETFTAAALDQRNGGIVGVR